MPDICTMLLQKEALSLVEKVRFLFYRSDPLISTVFTGKIAALFPLDSHLKVGGAAIFPGADFPPVINHSTLACVCHYPGADCHQSTIPPWPMCVTIQGQTATSHQPFHPGLCVSLSRGRLPPVINHSTLAYVCHYPGADCHQSSTIPPWPVCVTIQGPSEVDSL